jgi:hypothetical protein
MQCTLMIWVDKLSGVRIVLGMAACHQPTSDLYVANLSYSER